MTKKSGCKLIFISVPSRLIESKKDIEKQMDIITNMGNAPLHPFVTFPFDRYEKGPVTRRQTLQFCCRLIDISDQIYFLGISSGTLYELKYALKKKKPVKLLLDQFDPNWRQYYLKINKKVDLLKRLI